MESTDEKKGKKMTQEIDAGNGEKKSIESVRKAAEDKTRKEARGRRGATARGAAATEDCEMAEGNKGWIPADRCAGSGGTAEDCREIRRF